MIRILPLITALVLISCSKTPATEASATASPGAAAAAQTATAEAPKPVPAQLPDVLARVNGEAISRAEFERAVQALEARAGGPVPAEQRDEVLRGVLDQIVGYKVLLQESKARRVVVADTDVEDRLGQIRSQFPDDAAFTQMLAERKLSLEQIRTDARQDMAISKLIDSEIASKLTVTPEQVSDFYAKNPDQFQQGESVRASHILIGAARDATAAAKAQARTKAEQVLKEVKAGGDFAALAKQHSSDPGSAANGGDLGFFQQGQMVGPFNEAAFKLAPGATSDLVETEFGFHIIRVAEKQPARAVPLDQARPQLEQYLQQMNRQQQTDAFVKGLKDKAKVEILI